jgi:mannose-6-phosphate isomerase-like protein (cupin superfamily)
MTEEVKEPIKGDGYSVANVDGIGEGPGFRKIRRELDVGEMGVNAIVLPEGYETGSHYHDEQEELYFVHRGTVEIEFGDGSVHRLGPGGLARVAASTPRKMRNVGKGEATYVCVGAKGGYVGRDGHAPEGR